MKVFLDVGAYKGNTLLAVLGPRYGFDVIHCFEPVHRCVRHLHRIAAEHSTPAQRIVINHFGLWNRTGTFTVTRAGTLNGSVMREWHPDSTHIEQCTFVRASEWVADNLSERNGEVYMKLNCEGAECDILDDLIDSQLVNLLTVVYIDFDVRRIPALVHREFDVRKRIESAQKQYNTRFLFRPDVYDNFRGTHVERTRHWLDLAGARA